MSELLLFVSGFMWFGLGVYVGSRSENGLIERAKKDVREGRRLVASALVKPKLNRIIRPNAAQLRERTPEARALADEFERIL